MKLDTWWMFVGVTFFLSATPGPNMLLVLNTSARCGLRSSFSTMAGCMTALLAMFSLSAVGLGALLQAFPSVFGVLRLAGAAYLVYLGIKAWRTPTRPAVAVTDLAANRVAGCRGLYRGGILVAASNPKALLFAASFLPQFIQADAPKLPQFAILLITFAVIEVSWYLVYATSGRGLAGYLERDAVRTAFNRLTGGVFIGFAGIMAALRG